MSLKVAAAAFVNDGDGGSPQLEAAAPSDSCSCNTPVSDNEMNGNSDNSAYSGSEESVDDFPADKKKKATKHLPNTKLPDLSRTSASGQYYEFEQEANGVDGYFDGSSDSDDELGGNEDNSFNFEMCRIRRKKRFPNSPPSLSAKDAKKAAALTTQMDMAHGSGLLVGAEAVDEEDVLCIIREDIGAAPPLAQEDSFDELDR